MESLHAGQIVRVTHFGSSTFECPGGPIGREGVITHVGICFVEVTVPGTDRAVWYCDASELESQPSPILPGAPVTPPDYHDDLQLCSICGRTGCLGHAAERWPW